MYRKKFLPKLVIASLLVGGVNFVPAVVNFDAGNLKIISVAYAEVKTVTANGSIQHLMLFRGTCSHQ